MGEVPKVETPRLNIPSEFNGASEDTKKEEWSNGVVEGEVPKVR
jgi:hypothetical protein